jgi:hypothetical protein
MGIFNEQSDPATESYVDSSVSNATNEINETINTVSGSLNTTINTRTFSDLVDTPEGYEEGYYLTSTVSGTEWSPAGYDNWDGGSSASNFGGILGADGGNAGSF